MNNNAVFGTTTQHQKSQLRQPLQALHRSQPLQVPHHSPHQTPQLTVRQTPQVVVLLVLIRVNDEDNMNTEQEYHGMNQRFSHFSLHYPSHRHVF